MEKIEKKVIKIVENVKIDAMILGKGGKEWVLLGSSSLRMSRW